MRKFLCAAAIVAMCCCFAGAKSTNADETKTTDANKTAEKEKAKVFLHVKSIEAAPQNAEKMITAEEVGAKIPGGTEFARAVEAAIDGVVGFALEEGAATTMTYKTRQPGVQPLKIPGKTAILVVFRSDQEKRERVATQTRYCMYDNISTGFPQDSLAETSKRAALNVAWTRITYSPVGGVGAAAESATAVSAIIDLAYAKKKAKPAANQVGFISP